MIRVCDAIMGSGKTESAISYMNEHPDKKFIYITPYLNEATRIRESCPALHFVEPEEKYLYVEDREDDEHWKMYDIARRTKVRHTAELIKDGKNVATTHQAFLYYTSDMLDDIRNHHYTLIIDEDLQVLEQYKIDNGDLKIAVNGGLIQEDGDRYILSCENYRSGHYLGMVRLLKSRDMVKVFDRDTSTTAVFWMLTASLIESFDDVFILTYLFKGQSLYYLLEMNNLEYDCIGIRKDETGYHLDKNGTYVPEYASQLINKIHIEQSKALNEVGQRRTALSATWMRGNKPQHEVLRKNIYNFLRNRAPGDATQRMWTTFKKGSGKLRGKGYTKGFVPLNKKATNDYIDRISLVYAANIFMHPSYTMFYRKYNIDVNEDLYALSTMVQWIFRSAIRRGDDVWIYIPSRRMRELLENWLAGLANGGRASEVLPDVLVG